jgi:hypothetical protein
MWSLAKKLLLRCTLVAALLPQVSLGQERGTLPSIEGRYFEVVGTDYRSVSYVNELGSYVVEVCSRYLQLSASEASPRIFIGLRPEDRVDFEGDYQIRQTSRGGVSLDLRWEAALTQETLCYALVDAHVTRYAIFNYGPHAVDRIRLWAISTLAAQAYLSLRPAQQVSYIQESRKDGVSELRPLLQLNVADAANPPSPRAGYWVAASLAQFGFDRTAMGDLIEKAVAGVDVSAELEQFIQATDADLTLQDWWQGQVAELMRAESEVYETMEASLEWLTLMVDFEAYRAEGGGELVNLRSLWKLREDEALRSILSARSEIIRLRLDRVNPAYYNAAHSLGVLYETALNGERIDSFIHALVLYLSDWEDTKRLHKQVVEALDVTAGQ